MDDILEHSQLRMLEAFSHLSKRVDSLAASRRPVQRSAGKVDQANSADLGYVKPSMQLTFLMYRTALIHMRQRIEAIEDKQETFVDIINQLRAGLATWEEETSSLDVSTHFSPSSRQADERQRWQADAILSIQEKLHILQGDSGGRKTAKSETAASTKRSAGLNGALGGTMSSALQVMSVSVVIALLCEVVKRFLASRRTHRKSM